MTFKRKAIDKRVKRHNKTDVLFKTNCVTILEHQFPLDHWS